MKNILILGQGAIGTFLGIAFSGQAVHYVRTPSHARTEVQVNFRDMRRSGRVKKGYLYTYPVVTDIQLVRDYSYIIVSVPFYQLRQAIEDLRPWLHSRQTVVVAGNVWDDFSWLDANLPCPWIIAFPNFGGGIQQGKINGWLTSRLTMGVTHPDYQTELESFRGILEGSGFRPRQVEDIRGWLLVHLAVNAGLMTEACFQRGFQNMGKSLSAVKRIYHLQRECLEIIKYAGVDPLAFEEGRTAYQPIWWNSLKTFAMFRIPGLAKSIDANMNLTDWASYGKALFAFSKEKGLSAPMLATYQHLFK